MKALTLIVLFSTMAVAPTFATSVKHKAGKEAFQKAHDACLMENKELKGKELKECIMKKEHENKVETTATHK